MRAHIVLWLLLLLGSSLSFSPSEGAAGCLSTWIMVINSYYYILLLLFLFVLADDVLPGMLCADAFLYFTRVNNLVMILCCDVCTSPGHAPRMTGQERAPPNWRAGQNCAGGRTDSSRSSQKLTQIGNNITGGDMANCEDAYRPSKRVPQLPFKLY
jgi:hypothetical protein